MTCPHRARRPRSDPTRDDRSPMSSTSATAASSRRSTSTRTSCASCCELSADAQDRQVRGHRGPTASTGKEIALIFEKTSTRTRAAFEVAAHDQGATRHLPRPDAARSSATRSRSPTPPGCSGACTTPSSSAAAPRTTSRSWPATPACPSTTASPTSGTPPRCSPTSSPCTRRRTSPTTSSPTPSWATAGTTWAARCWSWVRSWAPTCASCGPAAPPAPGRRRRRSPNDIAERTGARITITDDPAEAVAGADFIHTDVWVSMGEAKDVWIERVELLRALPGQPRRCSTRPATRRRSSCTASPPSTTPTPSSGPRSWRRPNMPDGLEVTNEVFESPASIVFDQAENRLHTIKAILVATLG